MDKKILDFSVAYPEKLSRGILLLKTFFGWLYVGIPHGIVLGIFGVVASIVTFIAWWVILFTGKYPANLFKLVEGYFRWSLRAGAYMGLMTDIYPPFKSEEIENHPVKISIVYPEKLSRGTLLLKTFFGWLYVGIPHGIVLGIFGIILDFILFISWFIILFTGKFPESFFKMVEGYLRWCLRVYAYIMLMTDVYPPFKME